MKSITYGDVTIEQIRSILEEKITKNDYQFITITVGTDSQSFCNHTKLVRVIAIRFETRGGIFFYECDYIKPVQNLHQKLMEETSRSIDLAVQLSEQIHSSEISLLSNSNIIIHSDIGKNGPTNALINEIVGWITACGFECEIKPNSTTASSIANKITK